MKRFSFLILILISVQSYAQYCTPTYNPDPAIFVHNFNLGDIVNRNSSADEDAYTYYSESEFTTELEIGRQYPFTASSINSAGIKGDFAIWIDYDNDSTFTAAERIHYVENVNHYTSGILDIPEDLNIVGKRRIRISYVWTSDDLEPCGTYNVGETEDYDVTFVTEEIDQDYYCMPFDALNTDNFIIDTFNFGDIMNTTSGSNEFNYSVYPEGTFTAQFVIGESYDYYISLENEASFDGSFVAWIDYNDDQIFSESEIVIEEGPEAFGAEGSLAIPSDMALVGSKRMRVRAHWNGDLPLDPCGFDSGTETEDYQINIVTEIIDNINEVENKLNISVFPNPAEDLLFIKNEEFQNYYYKVYDMLGNVLIVGSLDFQSIVPLNIQDLDAGLHLLEIHKGDYIEQLKFLKF